MSENHESHTGPIMPYGVAIREAVSSGDQAKIRSAAEQARRWLADNPGHANFGEVQAELRKIDESRS